jgi:hypothetical protein
VIHKAVALAKAAGKLFGLGKEKDPAKDKADKEERLEKGLTAAQKAVNRFAGKPVGKLVLNPILTGIKLLYRMQSLEVIPMGDSWGVEGVVNPKGTKKTDAKVQQNDTLPPGVSSGVMVKVIYRSGEDGYVALIDSVDNENKMVKYHFVAQNLTRTTTFSEFTKVFVEIFIEDKRQMFMGSTPGKRSDVGESVISRMRSMGQIAGSKPNEQVLHNGKWYPIDECDMSHIQGASEWWNSTGVKFGPRSREVTAFMNNPSNYFLEPLGPNRSRGSSAPRYAQPKK